MYIIATDLDRTLLYNGLQEYDGSMELFSKIVEKEKLMLIFVTGRNLNEVKEAIKDFGTPEPDYIVAEVGTRIYHKEDGKFVEDEGWIEKVNSLTKNWDVEKFRESLAKVEGLGLQEDEKQNRFKHSYYIDLENPNKAIETVSNIIRTICEDAVIVYSVDETSGVKFLDVLPKHATKVAGLEYLREKLGLEKDKVVFCGDSGNDILPLTFGYKAVLVRNAIDEVKDIVIEVGKQKGFSDKIYIAKGDSKLNGYYVSGIIEGLLHFRIVSEISKYA